MTDKQQQAQNEKNLKAQQQYQLELFKDDARRKSLEVAQYTCKNETTDIMLKEADKIYKWLLNGKK